MYIKMPYVMLFMTYVLTGPPSQTILHQSPISPCPSDTRPHNGGKHVKVEETLSVQTRTDKNTGSVADIIKTLDNECNSCKPVTPLECITSCNVWKLRNELRRLCETMESPSFMKDLLNVLKNDTRLHILQAITKSRHSVSKLQQELK